MFTLVVVPKERGVCKKRAYPDERCPFIDVLDIVLSCLSACFACLYMNR